MLFYKCEERKHAHEEIKDFRDFIVSISANLPTFASDYFNLAKR